MDVVWFYLEMLGCLDPAKGAETAAKGAKAPAKGKKGGIGRCRR